MYSAVSSFCSSCWWRCYRCHCCCLYCISVSFVSFFLFLKMFDECRIDGRESWIVHLCIQLLKMDVKLRCINKFVPRSNAVQSSANTMYFQIHSASSTLNLDISTLYTYSMLTYLHRSLQFTHYFVTVDIAHCTRSIFLIELRNLSVLLCCISSK